MDHKNSEHIFRRQRLLRLCFVSVMTNKYVWGTAWAEAETPIRRGGHKLFVFNYMNFEEVVKCDLFLVEFAKPNQKEMQCWERSEVIELSDWVCHHLHSILNKNGYLFEHKNYIQICGQKQLVANLCLIRNALLNWNSFKKLVTSFCIQAIHRIHKSQLFWRLNIIINNNYHKI